MTETTKGSIISVIAHMNDGKQVQGQVNLGMYTRLSDLANNDEMFIRLTGAIMAGNNVGLMILNKSQIKYITQK